MTAQEIKTTKFDKEINKICKIKTGTSKDSRNNKLENFEDNNNTYSIPKKVYSGTSSAFGRKGSSISKNKNKDKQLHCVNTFDNQLFNMMANIDKKTPACIAKQKHDTKRSDGRKVQTEKVSQKQTIQKTELACKSFGTKHPQEIDVSKDSNEEIKIRLNNTANTTPTQLLNINTSKVNKDNQIEEANKSEQYLLQERKQFLSFGLLSGNENGDKRRESQHKVDGSKIACKSSERKDKNKDKSKGEEEEASLSLVSYEETEVGDEKYYNEEELTKILGCMNINKLINKKEEASKKLKKKEEIINPCEDYQPQNNYTNDNEHDAMDDESEILFDKETIRYIEKLKDKFGFDGDIDPYEFIQKIQCELNKGVKNEKQRLALEELKRCMLEDLAQCPIPIDEGNDNEYSKSLCRNPLNNKEFRNFQRGLRQRL